MPQVSVVLPVRDAAATLPRALAGIEAQTLRDWELVAVADGSTDATGEILRVAAARDPRVRVLTLGPVGIVGALNAGLAAARAPLVARMDADDESHPERLAAQADLLATQPAVGVVGCLVRFGGDRRAAAGYALHVDWLNSLVTSGQVSMRRFVEAPLAHPSAMFRRSLVEAHGGYRDGDFPEDYELWLRWLDAGVRFAKVPRELLIWHDPPARLSRTDPRYSPEAFFALKAVWLARWLAREIESERRILVWGAGRPTRRRAAHLEAHGVAIAGYIDIDPKKTGRTVGGRPVLAPADLPAPGEAFVLAYVASRGARELIGADLARRGWVEGRDYLLCA